MSLLRTILILIATLVLAFLTVFYLLPKTLEEQTKMKEFCKEKEMDIGKQGTVRFCIYKEKDTIIKIPIVYDYKEKRVYFEKVLK